MPLDCFSNFPKIYFRFLRWAFPNVSKGNAHVERRTNRKCHSTFFEKNYHILELGISQYMCRKCPCSTGISRLTKRKCHWTFFRIFRKNISHFKGRHFPIHVKEMPMFRNVELAFPVLQKGNAT